MTTLTTLQLGTEVQIIDLKTGKLTRQGLQFFQSLTSVPDQVNTNTSDLATHIALAATTAALGHVKKTTAVPDAGASVVSVDSPDATNDATNLTLSNEIKGDVNDLVDDVNSIQATLNSLMAALRTAGVQAT